MKKLERESGVAMIFALMAIVVIAGVLAVSMTRMQSSKTNTDHAIDEMLLEEVAQAGIEMMTKQLWRDYIETSGNTTRNWASYRAYLNSTLDIPLNEDLNGNGALDPGEDGNGNGQLDVPSGDEAQYGKEMLTEPRPFSTGDSAYPMATLESVRIARFDSLQNAWLTVRSTATIGSKNKTAVQVLEIGAPTRNHAQFAILANNISCILCHAEVRSLPLELNNTPDNYNNFDRVKVASLESIVVRANEADSNLAGTLYSRGKVLQQNFSEYNAAQLQASQLRGYQHSTVNGKIMQGATGNMTNVPMVAATTNASGDLNQFANLYLNYPTDENQQTDGPVPNSFPAPFPDENGNRVVDDNEFEAIMNTATGRIVFESGGDNQGGAISTGVAFGVPAGQLYPYSNSLPPASNNASGALAGDGYYDGNLVLVGTEDDPITIQGTVAVNGDLVIQGKIKGEGQLLVRGNTYVTGDVTYSDDTEFGVAEDGSENAFALLSGGSVMMGDYTSVRGVNHSARNNEQYPSWSQYSIDTRTRNRSNSVTMKVNNVNKTETLPWGYFDSWSVDSNQVVNNRPGQQFSFTMSELQLFNMMEVNKAKSDPSYKPRFYGLREGQPNNIWLFDSTKGNNQEHAVRYSYAGVYTLANYVASFGLDPSILTRATYQYLNPKGNWISEGQLREIWWRDEQSRPSSGRPFKFDGLLYSNNSIFAIARSKERHFSNTNGQMVIRGGIISADLGIFAPGGVDVLYDPRVERFIELRDDSIVTFAKTAFYFEPTQSADS